jgi:hypothetical protein
MSTSKVMTPEFRGSFVNILAPDPRKLKDDGKTQYGITMLIPKTADISGLVAIYKEAALEGWPDPAKRPTKLVNPIKDGDTDEYEAGGLKKDKYPEMAGCWVINASSTRKPGVVDENVQPIIDPEEIKSGYWYRATVNAFFYKPDAKSPKKKSGVGIGLINVQKLREDETFGAGGGKAEDDFAPVTPPPGSSKATPAADPFAL